MRKQSAGILAYRLTPDPEVFLVHPGGPYWANKDDGAWSIPKGEYENEDPLQAAIREFREETAFTAQGPFFTLTPQRQKSGKTIAAFAIRQDLDTTAVVSNTFDLEWPPNSGRIQSFPEIDRAEWFPLEQALVKLIEGQRPFLQELANHLLQDP